MQQLSILLGLTGSEQSKYAAEVAWALAKRCEGRVHALHVVDTRSAWDMLRNEKPGYIGSGVYVLAYETLCNSLRNIGNALSEKFTAVAEGQAVPTDVFMLEGDPVKSVCDSARDNDLVIIGHEPRNSAKKDQHRHIVRFAVAEALAHECVKPLIIVQGALAGWSNMSVLVSADHLNFEFIAAAVRLARFLELPVQLVVLTTGTHEQPADSMYKDIRAAHPELKDIQIEIAELSGVAVEKRASIFQQEIELDWKPDPDTLMVIPTRSSGGNRVTVFDTSPDLFVRHLSLPSIMMWPEEHVDLNLESKKSKKKSASLR